MVAGSEAQSEMKKSWWSKQPPNEPKKQTALEKYQIAESETPWYNIKSQGVDFDDYREKI